MLAGPRANVEVACDRAAGPPTRSLDELLTELVNHVLMDLLDLLRGPWPWFVAGPAIGLVVPILLVVGGRRFGLSSSYRHLCAAANVPARSFRYDWRRQGGWNLLLVAGIAVGGLLGGVVLGDPNPLRVAEATTRALEALGVTVDGGLAPTSIFSWAGLGTPAGFTAVVVGGFLIGFGARWANGCTSGHAIMGLAERQPASVIAVAGFFAGGLVATHLLWPLLLGGT